MARIYGLNFPSVPKRLQNSPKIAVYSLQAEIELFNAKASYVSLQKPT